MEKSEWWQSPVLPAAFCGAIVLMLGFAVCGRSEEAPPAEASTPPAHAVAAREDPSPPEEVSATTTTATPVASAPPAAHPVTKAEATAILVELHALEKMGREMAGNRYKGDLATATAGDMAGQRRCIDAMREARPRLDKIRARTATLPDAAISIGLGASELGVCLTCVRFCRRSLRAGHDGAARRRSRTGAGQVVGASGPGTISRNCLGARVDWSS